VAVNPKWDSYIKWSKGLDATQAHISTDEEWAIANGVADRTVRRWKQSKEFQDRVRVIAASERKGTVSVVSEDMSVDEAEYLQVKAQILESAKGGNIRSQDLYIKTYGKSFLEAELTSATNDLAGLDLDSLVCESVLAIGEALVAAALRERGWTVFGPELSEIQESS
jgi:hypothetical protein